MGGGGGVKEEDTTWTGLGRFNPCNPNLQGLVYPIWFNPGSIRSKCQLFSGRGKKSRELMFPSTACDGIITSAYYKATIQVSLTLGGGQGWGYPICQILACTSTS